MNATTLIAYQEEEDPYVFEDFAPTLSQCFVIVFVGYLTARFEVLSSSDVKGVNMFASYFAMPGIICLSLADSNFSVFRWELLVGIFVGKLVTFVLVAGLMLYLRGNFGVAGLMAVFCVHSNDLPVGNPLISVLYQDLRPQMMKYLFLIPAMTVIFFIPLGNLMMKLERLKKKGRQSEGRPSTDRSWRDVLPELVSWRVASSEIVGILKHPVVIATAVGLILNCIFKGDLPSILHQPIKVAAATIPGIALMLLGFSFVRKERYFLTSAVIPAVVLVFLKTVFTPVLLHTLVRLMTEPTRSAKHLSDFGLLYGVISPATAVFQSGPEFRKPLAVMSVTLILTSFICFPVSFVIAKCTFLTVSKLGQYVPHLRSVLFWTACASILCDVTLLLIMTIKGKWRQVRNCYIFGLIFTQLLMSLGIFIGLLAGTEKWVLYCKVALFYGGEISGYLWTGMMAVVLTFNKKFLTLKKSSFVILTFVVASVSVVLTLVLCLIILGSHTRRAAFIATVIMTVSLFACLIVVNSCLLFHLKKQKIAGETKESDVFNVCSNCQKAEAADCSTAHEMENSPAPPHQGDSAQVRRDTQVYFETSARDSNSNHLSVEEREWTTRMSSLLMILSMLLIVRCINYVYRLIRSTSFEITVPLEYLQTLFVGQGILFLFVFGIDVRTIVLSLRKWWRKSRFGNSAASARTSRKSLPKEVVQFCQRFSNFYFSQCFRDIARERRWKSRVYRDSFWGHQLVDWLISEGLCQDDSEAEETGQRLLDGGVIQHVQDSRGFSDSPYLYFFNKAKQATTDSSRP